LCTYHAKAVSLLLFVNCHAHLRFENEGVPASSERAEISPVDASEELKSGVERCVCAHTCPGVSAYNKRAPFVYLVAGHYMHNNNAPVFASAALHPLALSLMYLC
jgi:hypothetical protein